MEVLLLEDAKQLGLSRFFTGVPCKNGHIAERYISGRNSCVVCKAEAEKRWYDKNHDKVLEYRSKLRQSDKWQEYIKEYSAEYRKEHATEIKQYNQTNKEYYRNWVKNHRRTEHGKRLRMLTEAKGRAAKSGLEFNLTYDDIVIPEICPILGIVLDLTGVDRESAPSLDRINNARGYVKDNICVISMKANRLKSNSSIAELELILQYMKNQEISTTHLSCTV